MIKGKDGKWYPTKAKMLEAEAKSSEEAMAKKEEPKVEEKSEVEDNCKPFQKRMKMVDTIFKLREKGKSESEIAMYMLVAESWVKEVLQKGYEQTETELKAQYHIVDIPEKIISTSEESEIPKDKKPKKEKVVKEPKEKKESLWQIIEKLAPTVPFTPAEMVKIVQETYPNTYKDTSVKLHLAGLDTTNEKSAKNFPSLFKHAFLEHIGEGKGIQYQRKN